MALAAKTWVELNRENTQMNKEAEKIMTIENSDDGWGNFIKIER